VSTVTIDAPGKEAGSRMRTDLEELARVRQARFERRQARFERNSRLDPRVKALYLDRTVWNTAAIAAALGIKEHRVTLLKTSVRKRGRLTPHPAVLPDIDTVEGYIADKELWGIEAGRVREWAVQRGTHRLDPETGALIKESGATHGRPRSERPSLSSNLRPRRSSD
jgi:hypothetical protein